MRRSYSEKTDGLYVVYLGAVERLAAFVVILILFLLPVAPVFASEDTLLGEVSDPVLGEETETLPESDSQTEEKDLKESAEQAPLEGGDAAALLEEESDVPEGDEEETSDVVDASGSEASGAVSTASTDGASTASSAPEENISETGTTSVVVIELPEEGTATSTQSASSSGNEIAEATTTENGTHTEEGATTTRAGSTTDSGIADDGEAASTTPDTGTTTPKAAEESVEDTEANATTTAETESDQEEDIPSATSTPRVDGEVRATTSTTSREEQTEKSVEVTVFNNDENKYQFSSTECIGVGDGSFYCSELDDEDKRSGSEENGLLAAPDADGDMEIYFVTDGNQTQITHNLSDDLAPYYDPLSERIVWHRLEGDRYQIISYSLDTEEETQFTDTPYNNMEPVAHGDTTVWQSWIHDNWEIIVHENGSTTQITNNDIHDVAPYINEDYIIWQTQLTDAWYMSVYDRGTGLIEQIENDEGALIENPRFVLVYDARFENGDVQTVGYDLKTGKTVPLSSTPAPLPESIPEPDQTGEKRALIQHKPAPEEEGDIEDDDADGGEPPVEPVDVTKGGAPTTTSDTIIVIPPLDDSAEASTTSEKIEPLIIEGTTDATTTDTLHIEDVVILEETPRKEE